MLSFEVNQSVLRGGQRVPLAQFRRVATEISKQLRMRQPLIISVAFVKPKEMTRLNQTYRGKNKLTDVLSFPYETSQEREVGEVLISYEQAKKQAKGHHSVRQELLFLLVHGTLHVFGYDHIKPRDAAKMFPLQTSILRALNIDPTL